jgi:hypothetical protein
MVLDVVDVHPIGPGTSAHVESLLASDQVGAQRQPAVDIRVARNDGDQVQAGVFAQGVGEQLGDLRRPQVLVLQVDQAARPPDRLAVAARDAAFAVRGEVVDPVGVGIGAQHLNGVRPAYRRVRRLLGQSARTQVGAVQPVL